MRRDVLLYLSGPMLARHGFTSEENIAAGVAVFLECVRRGLPAFCPHLVAFTDYTALSYGEWLTYDYAVLDRCTHLVQLDRWETSTGARLEADYATEIGLPVISVAEAFAL